MLAVSRKERFPKRAFLRQECLSGKLLKKEYPLGALVTRFIFRNCSEASLLETSLLDTFRLLRTYPDGEKQEKSVFSAKREISLKRKHFLVPAEKPLGAGSSGVDASEKDTEESVFSAFLYFSRSKVPVFQGTSRQN